MTEIRPAGITAQRQARRLVVDWQDGHRSEYSFTLLRLACPCAECRGGHENMGRDPDPEVYALPELDSSATRMVNIEAVGSYAVTINWEDGHHYGIYKWDYLRALCPCDECRLGVNDE